MNLDEAIENRKQYLKNSKVPKSTDDYNATLLSIEALKYIIYRDNCPGINTRLLLPGETKE